MVEMFLFVHVSANKTGCSDIASLSQEITVFTSSRNTRGASQLKADMIRVPATKVI